MSKAIIIETGEVTMCGCADGPVLIQVSPRIAALLHKYLDAAVNGPELFPLRDDQLRLRAIVAMLEPWRDAG